MDAVEVDVPLTILEKPESAAAGEDEGTAGDEDGTEAGEADAAAAEGEEGKEGDAEEGKAGEETEPAAPAVMSATLKIQSNLSLQTMASEGRIVTFSSFAVVLPGAAATSAENEEAGADEAKEGADEAKEESDEATAAAEGEEAGDAEGGEIAGAKAAPALQLCMKQDFLSFTVAADASGLQFPSVTCFLTTSDVAELKKSITTTDALAFVVEEKATEVEAKTEEGGDEDGDAADDADDAAEAKGDDGEAAAEGEGGDTAEAEPAAPLPSYEASVVATALLEVGEISCSFEAAELGARGSISGTVVLSKALVPIPPEPPAPELTLDDIVPERPVGCCPASLCSSWMTIESETHTKLANTAPTRPQPIVAPTKSAHVEMKTQVAEIASTILDEIDRLNMSAENSELLSKDERRRRLLSSLNTSGKYYNFRENMRKCIVKVVKENFAQRGGEEGSANDSALFLTELYAHLMEHVHAALNTEFEAALGDSAAHRKVGYNAVGRESPLAQQLMSSRKANATASASAAGGAAKTVEFGLERLLGLAFEAEVNGNVAHAGKCHKDRVALSESEVKKAGGSANVSFDATAPWCDLACFHGRNNEVEKAIECASEGSSLILGSLFLPTGY